MAIEISPYAFRREEARPAFRSPLWALIAVSGVLLVMSAGISLAANILHQQALTENGALTQEIQALQAKRNPKEVAQIRQDLSVLGEMKRILDSHGSGENIFAFLEGIVQDHINISSVSFSSGEHPTLNLTLEANAGSAAAALTAAATQVAAFEEEPGARILTARATSFPIDEKEGTVKFSANLNLTPGFLLPKR